MIKVENNTNVNFLGKDLIKAIYKVAGKLDADYVVVDKARYNKYAEISLFEDNNCIDWAYTISVN